jgi:succinate dehydrogenase/fumarate reductase flavoprotein subunit
MELADMGLTFLKKDGEIDILSWGPTNVTLFDAPKSLVALKKAAVARGVRMMDKIFVVDLLKSGDRVVGAVALGLVDGHLYVFNAKAVILATGNCGYLHEKTYASVLGEGPAMGYRAGAQVTNAEFNSMYVWGIKMLGKELMGIHFYLHLENALGEKIMGKYYPELMVGEHAVYTFDPRVIRAMYEEVKAGRGPIYINLKGLTDAEIAWCGDDIVPELTHLMANDTMLLVKEKCGLDPSKERMECGRATCTAVAVCVSTSTVERRCRACGRPAGPAATAGPTGAAARPASASSLRPSPASSRVRTPAPMR